MSDATELIKENLGIAELVGRYAQLKRRGNRLVACCPLHQEKTPSFYVDQNKGLYHCFGCGKGGDLIHFAQEIEGLSFVEALDFLADMAGIELPKRRADGPGRDVIEQIRAINLEAVAFYHRQLKKHKPALAYLEQRGLQENTINLFKMGYAPAQWDALYQHLASRFPEEALSRTGLFKIGKSGKPFDIFRDRVIFPIYDVYGHVIAFGGRLMSGEDGPKYINSPETPLYTKGRHLYNLNFAKVFLKKNPAVVVEATWM